MKKTAIAFFAFGFVSVLSSFAVAGTANVTMIDVKSEAGKDAVQELSRVFNSMAKRLPEAYSLDVHITDMHLSTVRRDSCDAHPGSIDANGDVYLNNQCSTSNPTYNWPRLSFQYTLKDQQGNTIAEGKEELKDMSFSAYADVGSVYRYKYEVKLVKDWFRHQSRENIFPKDAS